MDILGLFRSRVKLVIDLGRKGKKAWDRLPEKYQDKIVEMVKEQIEKYGK